MLTLPWTASLVCLVSLLSTALLSALTRPALFCLASLPMLLPALLAILTATAIPAAQYCRLLSPAPADLVPVGGPGEAAALLTALFSSLALLLLSGLALLLILARRPPGPAAAGLVRNMAAVLLVSLPAAWLAVVAGQQSGRPGHPAAYCGGPLLLLQAGLTLAALLRRAGPPARPGPPGSRDRGALQSYLAHRTGQRKDGPAGVRGTVSRRSGRGTTSLSLPAPSPAPAIHPHSISSRGSESCDGSAGSAWEQEDRESEGDVRAWGEEEEEEGFHDEEEEESLASQVARLRQQNSLSKKFRT